MRAARRYFDGVRERTLDQWWQGRQTAADRAAIRVTGMPMAEELARREPANEPADAKRRTPGERLVRGHNLKPVSSSWGESWPSVSACAAALGVKPCYVSQAIAGLYTVKGRRVWFSENA